MADYDATKTYAVSGEELHGIAEAIRLKRDITDGIPVSDMAMQVGLISGGGKDFILDTVTLTEDSTTINVPKKPNWNRYIALAIKDDIVYNSDGSIGALYLNTVPFGADGDKRERILSVFETRTTYVNYVGVQSNNYTVSVWDTYHSVTDTYEAIVCRNNNYKFLAGTYTVLSICLD